jgi:hypothetical protein
MTRKTEEIACPRFPEHGTATKRWLAPSERQMLVEEKTADVFEIDCPRCGKYEQLDPFSQTQSSPKNSI